MRLSLILPSLLVITLAAKHGQDTIEYWNANGREYLARKLNSDVGKIMLKNQKQPKNVILFIGDGMGIATITAGRISRNQQNGNPDVNTPFFFENLPFSGLAKTSSYDTHTTDSAASAVALMTGRKVESDTLGRLPGYGNKCEFGDKAKIKDGIADLALEKGVDIGFVTTASITDATPGALYAKDVHRRMEFNSGPYMNGTQCDDIASQLLSHPANKFKVMMGGGHAQFLPDSVGGNRTDARDLEQEWKHLSPMQRAHSRVLLTGNDEFIRHTPQDDQQLLGIFAPLHFPYRVDEILRNSNSVPSLTEMAVKAIQVMNKQTDSKGYFLMIEGANIDKAQHKNRFHLAAEELNEFDKAIEEVTKMVGDDTLIVITADHAHALTIPGYIKKNTSIYERDGNMTAIFYASGPGFGDGKRGNYTPEESRDPHFAQPASIFFNDGRHGGEDVGVWSTGPFAWLFSGTMDNTQIAYNIKYLMCLDDKEESICDLRQSMRVKQMEEESERLKSATTESPRGESIHILTADLPLRGILIALLVLVCLLAVIVTVLLVILIRSNLRRSVKPSNSA